MPNEDEKSLSENSAPEDLSNSSETIFNDYLTILGAEFESSMTALQVQNIEVAKSALFKAKNIYKDVSLRINDDRILVFKILVNYIEVALRILRSVYHTLDDRHKKALEELEEANKLCEAVYGDFNNLNNLDKELSEGLLIYIKSLFIFFDCIVSSSMEAIKAAVARDEGKFVDEIETLRESTKELRKFNDHTFDIITNDAMAPLVNILESFANINEKKIERLLEKRKKIDFLQPIDKKVFIIHGHNEARLKELNEILRNSFKIEPVILNEMPDNGDTIIEKFEEYARSCAFAFVLVTQDDWVENKGNKYFQARPNVLFELGWFCGRFGRNKVRILKQKGAEMPSDLNGIVTIEFYEKLEEAFRKIGMDLENNGLIEKKH